MAKRLATAVLAVTFIAVLAGCASGAGNARAVPTQVVTTLSALPRSGRPVATPAPPPLASLAVTPPSAIRPASSAPLMPTPTMSLPAGGVTTGGSELTLRGQVEQGVEPGCLILRSGGKTYELMTNDHNVVRAGAQVVVTGHVATGVMSHCMQGQPFTVTSARRG